MRLVVGCAVLVVCMFAMAMPVMANTDSGRLLRQVYTIDIEVECLDTAIDIINGLNGYNLESAVFVTEQWGQIVRQANFTRRVDNWAYDHVQAMLRWMGETMFESENAWHLGAQISDVEVRLLAISQEIERLAIMMATSTSLDVLIAIDSHLSRIMWDRDHLIGTHNLLVSQASSPIVNIQLFEIPEGRPVPTPVTFGSRITDSFLGSWNSLLRNAGNLTVFLVRIALPFIIWAGIIGLGLLVANNIRKKRLANESLRSAIAPFGLNTEMPKSGSTPKEGQ